MYKFNLNIKKQNLKKKKRNLGKNITDFIGP